MNRQEARNILYEIHADAFVKDNCWLKEHADSLLKYLNQPLTLVDLLGWEEGAEYEYKTPKFLKIKNKVLKIENNRLYQKSEECSSGWCNFPLFTDEIEDLRQAKKVEPKLKAWHVSDKYSWDCLVKELEEQGCRFSLWGDPTQNAYRTYYDCVAENEEKDLVYRDFEKMKREDYEIIEYKKEPPKFYAKIKGWELTNDGDCYWYKDESPIHGIYPWSEEEASIYTKEEWAELGITDENADFEEVQE